jgi:hypothetical protein
MRQINALVIAAAVVVVFACAPDPADVSDDGGADIILINARVYTLDWDEPARDGTIADSAPRSDTGWHPDAEAVATKGGEIVFVGSTGEAMKLEGEASRVIDLAGATVIPGLVDSHTHVLELGRKLDAVDLTDVETEEEAVRLVAEKARSLPPGEWIIGAGWDEGAWANRYPDKELLSEAVPDHPVFLDSLHGFAAWANQAALDAGGITADSEVPVGGEMRLGDDGEPNGLFLNRATTMLDAIVPPPPRETLISQFLIGLRQMAEDGYVAVHDAGLDGRSMSVLEQLEEEDRLPVRVYAMLSLRDEDLIRRWIEKGPDKDNDSMLVTRTVKAYYDGALGSRGARMLYDYSDQP